MRRIRPAIPRIVAALIWLTVLDVGHAQPITVADRPVQLDIRRAGESGIRATLKPIGYEHDVPPNPVLVDRDYPEPAISLREIIEPVERQVGDLRIVVRPSPLTVRVTNSEGELVQEVVFEDDGTLAFRLDDQPVLGLGEGGPRPKREVNWRELAVEFDRRGRLHAMRPRWQADAYGSRNPVPLLIGTRGWALFIAAPWGDRSFTTGPRSVHSGRAGRSGQHAAVQRQSARASGEGHSAHGHRRSGPARRLHLRCR